jgi:phosphoribosyl 1,2-cyclic phosphodiesterase
MKFTILGSGSSGNATLVVAGETAVLIDAGFSARETVRRMREADFDPQRLSAILITHEHGDHVGGMSVLARQLGVTVHIAPATRAAARVSDKDTANIRWGEYLAPECRIMIGNVTATPVSVPHDAADPLIFTLEAAGVKLGIVTDLGYIPPHVARRLEGCHALILEANHDRDMLKIGPYSWTLKQRIAGRHGHLSNDEMSRFLAEDFDGTAEHITLAHLSQQNNHPEIARLCALESLQRRHPPLASFWEERVQVAPAKGPTRWVELD